MGEAIELSVGFLERGRRVLFGSGPSVRRQVGAREGFPSGWIRGKDGDTFACRFRTPSTFLPAAHESHVYSAAIEPGLYEPNDRSR